MPSLAWGDRYVSGNPTIDRQHRLLFDAFDALTQACAAGTNPAAIGHFIDICRDHILTHFNDEEAEMERIGYPAAKLEQHRKAHEQVAEAVLALVVAQNNGDIVTAGQALHAADLMVEHIKREDAAFITVARAAWTKPQAPVKPAKSAAKPVGKPVEKPAKDAKKPARVAKTSPAKSRKR